MYEGDLAALVVSLSSISGRQMQSKYSINLELFSEKIPYNVHIINVLITCV
jgi:hypothetical protein